MTQTKASPTAPVALITGANTGIGLVAARELCRQGLQVFIACRTAATGQAAVDVIRQQVPAAQLELLSLDLGDFASVRRCAEAFLARGLPLHLLVNNAGLAGGKGLTASGFELAFGTNHLGHFLLTQLLLDNIKSASSPAMPGRIVTVASRAHYRVPAWNWEALQHPTKSAVGLAEYGVSKLANVLFSAELARRLAGAHVHTYALHPGVVASDVWRAVPAPIRWLIKRGMITTEEGALTTLHCATSPLLVNQTGLYYDQCQVKPASALGQDAGLAAELWLRSEAWVR